MKFSAAAVLLTAAIGASANDFVIAKKPAPVPSAPVALPSVSVPVPAGNSQSGDAASQGSGASTFTNFCGGGSSKRATAAQIAYKGNVGANGQYGCNMMTVQKNIVTKYQYSLTFTNKSGKDQVCSCWNKIGKDGGINGFFKGNQALDFTLPAGGLQCVVFDTNSQGACACGEGSVPTTSIGEFAATWVEYDFGNLSNQGWSGGDASCLVSAANKLPIPGLSVCYNAQCSTIFPGGAGKNAYVGGTEALDGVGLNIPPGPAHMDVEVN